MAAYRVHAGPGNTPLHEERRRRRHRPGALNNRERERQRGRESLGIGRR
jgi:hypothetical protein